MAVTWTIPTLEAAQISATTYVVTASNALDDGFAAEFRDLLLPLTGAEGSKVILDLAAVQQLGPVLLEIIASAARLAVACGGSFLVIASHPPLRNRLAECGLDDAIRIERTLQEGLAC